MDTGVRGFPIIGRLALVLGLALGAMAAWSEAAAGMPPIVREDAAARAMGIVPLDMPPAEEARHASSGAGDQVASSPDEAGRAGRVSDESVTAVEDREVPSGEDPRLSLLSRVLTGWTHRVELAASGTEGNARTGNFRGAFNASRHTELTQASLSLTYQYGTRDSSVTQERFVTSGRFDRLMKDSRWRSFLSGSFEIDRFRDWDYRLTGGGGFGYQVIKDEKTDLLARGGLSLAQDIGGLDEHVRSEAILGLDLARTIDERQKVIGALDFLPTIGEFDQFRINARLSWEILLDPESRLSLRIGGENRYDTTARAGALRNDISYYAGIAVEF